MPTESQLDLFSTAPAGPRPVGAAAIDDDTRALAGRLPRRLHLGTSSWSFPGWHGLVYDRAASSDELAREGLAAYARHPLLGMVGVDRTWHAPMTAAALAGYADAVPEDFRFLVKAPAACTTPFERASRRPNPLYLDPGWLLEHGLAPVVAGLGARAAALLVQFPPLPRSLADSPERFAARLHDFLACMPRDVPIAVEVRNPKLAGPAYFAALRALGVRHCLNVHPRAPSVATQLERMPASGPLLMRWNLAAGLAYEAARSRYAPFDRLVDPDPATRALLAEACARALAAGREVFVVANNKAEGSAPLTLSALAAAIDARLGSGQDGPRQAGGDAPPGWW